MLDLSIIILSYNTKDLLIKCLKSVKKHTSGIKYEIIVVDNNSIDGSVEALTKMGRSINLIKNKKNVGFAAANNQGAKEARGKYVLFLNSDTLISDNLLKEIVGWMEKHSEVAVASCALKNKDGSEQGTGGYFPTLLRVFSWMTIQDIPGVDLIIKPFHPMKSKSFSKGPKFYKKKRRLDWITGAFMLVRKKVFDKVGGFDENYHMYTEDVDLCYRIKQDGWQVWYLPDWSIIHYGGASSTTEFPILSEYKGIKRFYKKFYLAWQYPILRFFLKIGALGRIFLFGILEGKEAVKIYVKALQEA